MSAVVTHTPDLQVASDGACVFAACSCRWIDDRGHDLEGALAAHTEHVAAHAAITVPEMTPGDRVRFDGKATSWLVRATAAAGRYAVCTASIFGAVHYTVIDRAEQVRGAINVIGYGLGIDTTRGPDAGVDRAVQMLEHRPNLQLHPGADPDGWDPLERAWGISHRNRVPLRITRHDTATTSDRRAA